MKSIFGRRVVSVLAALAVLATFVWSAPAFAGSSSSAKDWANGVCGAVLDFGQAVDTTISGLKGSTSLDDAAQKAKSGLTSAAQTFQSSIDDLGSPPGDNAKKAKKAVDSLGTELQTTVTNIQSLLTPTPTGAAQIASTFASIGSEIQKAVSEVQSTANDLKSIASDDTLKNAFKSAPECKQLKKALS
jgi:methyl-accepting chemotaxis protein